EGMHAADGRYLAFLDYDDCIYPEAYSLLVAALSASHCAIAFGGIARKDAYVEDGVTIVRHRQAAWGERNLHDMLHDNCSPIHSYVLDRSRLVTPYPAFDESLSKYEDYDFLLKICMRHASDFQLSGKIIGDYYIKED